MDKLKEYLLRHKADLDVDSPASDTWEFATKPGLQAKSGFSNRVVRYAVAACVIALAGAGLWLVIKNNKAPFDTAKYNNRTIKRDSGKEKIENSLRNEGKTLRNEENTVRKEENTLRQEGITPGKDIAGNTSTPKQARRKARSQKAAVPTDEIGIIDKSYSKLIDYELRKLRTTPLYAENGSYFSFYVEQFKQMDQDEQQVRNDIKMYGLTNEFLEQLINVYQQKLNVLKNLQTEVNKMNNKVREKQAPSDKAEVHYLNI